MIVMFRGTKASKNNAPQTAALYAAANAVLTNRKTLVIQFLQRFPVERFLVGENKKAGGLKDLDPYSFDDSGIDSLLRRAEEQAIFPEDIDAASEMILDDDSFNVVKVSKRKDFSTDLLNRGKELRRVLEAAGKAYDDIFLVGDGRDEKQMELLNWYADCSIICVPQGEAEEIPAPVSVRGKKTITDKRGKERQVDDKNHVLVMITDYDRHSAYDQKRIRTEYGVKKNAYCPYSTGFRDACNSGSVFRFVLRNVGQNTKTSANDPLFSSVKSVLSYLDGTGNSLGEGTMDIDLSRLSRVIHEGEEEEMPEKKTLTADNAQYSQHFKKGLFGARHKTTVEITTGDGPENAGSEESEWEEYGKDSEEAYEEPEGGMYEAADEPQKVQGPESGSFADVSLSDLL